MLNRFPPFLFMVICRLPIAKDLADVEGNGQVADRRFTFYALCVVSGRSRVLGLGSKAGTSIHAEQWA